MKLYLEVVGDTNDADYISERTEITEDQLELIKPVIKAIKNSKIRHNWATSEYAREPHPSEMYKDVVTEDQIEEFEQYVPHGEHGIHTIKSITLLQAEETKLI